MFCILLANLRKQVKTPYNLLDVNVDFLDIEALNYIILFISHKARVTFGSPSCLFNMSMFLS